MDVDANNEIVPFLVKGHSDFRVTRLLNGNIQKSAAIRNQSRLKTQCHKQKNFITKTPRFIVCPVLTEFESRGEYGFEMPFCRGEVAPEYIDRASPIKIRAFIEDLIALIEEFISDSMIKAVDAKVICDKSMAVREAVKKNPCMPHDILSLIDKHINLVNGQIYFEIPIGKCHGDLTLSNIIFDDVNRQYFLIDFLDSYIESPILDLAKIAQETKLLWTSRLMLETHDASKYQIAMKTIDVGIQEYFRKYDWFIKYQTIFEFQNLIRLLPYVRDHKIAQLITSRLHVLMRT